MSRPDSSTVRDEILQEAGAWFIELNENPADQALRERFDRWLRRSPEHVHAFLQISVHWEEGTPRPRVPVESVDELALLAQTDSNVIPLLRQSDADAAASPSSAVPEASNVPPQSEAAPAGTGRYRPPRWLALAASLLVGAVTTVLVWQHFFRGVYGTGVGEQRALTLTDGSRVELNSRSRIRVRYTAQERRIDLLEGQVLFHVTKNMAQPFIVMSGRTQVRAVGTSFDVYQKEHGTVVTVVEGRVATSAPGAHAARADEVFVDAGQQITLAAPIASNAATVRPHAVNIEAATAWTRHRLIFKGAPLAEVIGEFNRYTERRMIITDPEIAAIRISGSFSTSDPTDLLRFLREVGAYEVRESAAVIEISRK
jgi:transmembrane sensor